MKQTYADITASWEAEKHAHDCDTSCPDCLRSYDNARRHSQLDWRLAIDLLELSLGLDLDLNRSLTGGVELLGAAAEGLNGAAIEVVEGLPVVVRQDRCVMLTHPLWRVEPAFFTELQAECFETASRRFDSVELLDIRSFRRNPLSAWPFLQG